MLATLGMFVFDMASAPFEELSRRRAWRHERTERFGAMAAPQFVGPGDDAITITGTLVPGLAGSYSSIDRLAEMANTGEAYPLLDGEGTVLGNFTIEGLDETRRYLTERGKARMVDFTLNLMRSPDAE